MRKLGRIRGTTENTLDVVRGECLYLTAPSGRMAGSWPGTSGLQLMLLPLVLLAVAPLSRAQSADQEWQRRILERRQVEQLPPAAVPEPSCTQLRLMWRQMHRMARHSQLTNEIPQNTGSLVDAPSADTPESLHD
ncbi:hypothetical protein HPB51_013948 [Rhipicephalus microplus]|uniref:Uncharacterized protein n=1 Tax=Rhipicephalus microplus TaxID=6941 RepID=A0A9J6DHB1_RHIMP|nr:hypothetical protein HPB51_013948 [Rhipicephalus microplus]